MENWWIPALIAFLGLDAIVIAVFVLLRRRRESWQAVADRLGLEFDPGSRRLGGRLDGHAVRVEALDTGSDGQAVGIREVLVAVDVVGAPPGLEVHRADGLVGKAMRLMTEERRSTGDAAFDEVALVRGDDGGWLDEHRRGRLRALFGRLPAGASCSLESGELRVSERRFPVGPKALEDQLHELVGAAADLEKGAA